MLRQLFFGHQFRPYRYVKQMPTVQFVRDEPRGVSGGDRVLTALGYGCVLFSLVGMGILVSPWLIARSLVVLNAMQKAQVAAAYILPHSNLGEVVAPIREELKAQEPKVDPATLPFSVGIPKLGIDSVVVPNVDASSQAEYVEALKQGAAHAYGSAFPGEGKMVYIFGHSTEYAWNVGTYNSLFYQLTDLVAEDRVYIQHGDETYEYEVREQHVVAPDDLSLLHEYADKDVLILQTCTPPGTTWQRLLVVAVPVE